MIDAYPRDGAVVTLACKRLRRQLPEIIEALDVFRPYFCPGQRRQQRDGQEGNGAHHHQQLGQGETVAFSHTPVDQGRSLTPHRSPSPHPSGERGFEP